MGWATHSVTAESRRCPCGCWRVIVCNGQNWIVQQPIWTWMRLEKHPVNEYSHDAGHWMVTVHRYMVNGCYDVENECSREILVPCCESSINQD